MGRHLAMQRVSELITAVAPTTSTVLIQGETGTGKEPVARAIHRESPRRDPAFVAVNVSTLPAGLVESELFGHAHEGTLFLDGMP